MNRILFASAAIAVVLVLGPAANSAEEKDICTIATENKDFSTLVTAVKAAGLDETLKGKGPFTVFAPSNAAFAKIEKEKLDAILKDKELLKKILMAHVVEGKVLAADAVKLDGKKVNGFDVKVADGGVSIGNAKVVKTDIIASNGVIHVIDTVLIPN